MSKLRDRILSKKDIKSEKVYVEEWGETLEVRGLNGKDRNDLLAKVLDQKTGMPDLNLLYSKLIILTSFDPVTGEKVFEEADRDSLNMKSGSALEKVAKVSARLSGLEQGAVEDAVKN